VRFVHTAQTSTDSRAFPRNSDAEKVIRSVLELSASTWLSCLSMPYMTWKLTSVCSPGLGVFASRVLFYPVRMLANG
jgi:hypothetical protein